jgi:transcriptional/translational regulatory protein YebC/TACO1
MDALEESDDAQQVYANFDIDADQLEKLSEAV